MIRKNLYGSLSKFIKPYKSKIVGVIILKLLILTCIVSLPYLLGNIVSSLENNSATIPYLLKYLAIFVGVYFIWNLMEVILEVLFENVNKSIENDIRTYCYETIIKSRMEQIQGKEDGEIITKVIRDTEKIEKAFSSMITFLDLSLYTIVTIIIMLAINLQLAFVILTMFFIIALTQRVYVKAFKKVL